MIDAGGANLWSIRLPSRTLGWHDDHILDRVGDKARADDGSGSSPVRPRAQIDPGSSPQKTPVRLRTNPAPAPDRPQIRSRPTPMQPTVGPRAIRH